MIKYAEAIKKYGGEEKFKTSEGDDVYVTFEDGEFVAKTYGWSPSEVRDKDFEYIINYFGLVE